MGFLSNLTELITSGVTWALNKIINAGGWAIAGIVACVTWITGALGTLLTSITTPLFSALPSLSDGMPDLAVYGIGLVVVPVAKPVFIALAIRFVIRRLPVVG